MRSIYGVLWGLLSGLTWLEVWVVWQARKVDSSSVALREHQIASAARATSITIGGLVGANHVSGHHVINHTAGRAMLAFAMALNAIPAIRFIYLYYVRGFR